MKKVKISEAQYKYITEEVQQNLFPDDKVTPEDEKKYYDKKNKQKERNEKAKELRKAKKEAEKKKTEKMDMIARGTGKDLFGNKYSDKEKKEAENYLKSKVKKKK